MPELSASEVYAKVNGAASRTSALVQCFTQTISECSKASGLEERHEDLQALHSVVPYTSPREHKLGECTACIAELETVDLYLKSGSVERGSKPTKSRLS